MRLSFPNGEHPDVPFSEGELSIGAAGSNGLSLPSAGLAVRHVSIRNDARRGILLTVLDRAAQVHVNARPVRELAVLRLGDVLSLNRLQILLKPDDDAQIVTAIPEPAAGSDGPSASGSAQRTAASRVVLRGVGGAHFGRSITLREPAVIGSAAGLSVSIDDPDVAARHAQVELAGERVLLRDLGSDDGALVNGVPVRDAVLHPGDQLAIGGQRFVLEAPGLPPRGAQAGAPAAGSGMGTTQTMQAVRADLADDTGSQRGSARSHIGWLIVTAVAIAAVIVALLAFAPR